MTGRNNYPKDQGAMAKPSRLDQNGEALANSTAPDDKPNQKPSKKR